jgi:predicted branched-subunit amino acid permease
LDEGGSESRGFGGGRRAAGAGAREALGAPGLVMGASYVGFGSLARESGFSVWQGLGSTVTGWTLPGQVALVELYAVGASLFAVTLAVALANARLLPMTVSLIPILWRPGTLRWVRYAIAHLIVITSWAQAMQRCPSLPRAERLPYFVAFSTTLWIVTLVATAVGYLLAGMVPEPVTLGLVFLTPIYFMLILAAEIGIRPKALALGYGAVAGPVLHLLTPNWGLLLTGVLAGTAAFLTDRRLGRVGG